MFFWSADHPASYKSEWGFFLGVEKRPGFQSDHSLQVSINANTTINICIAKRRFYIASLYNDMFRPLYWPSSGCTFSYFKANYTIYNVLCFCQQISCTSIYIYIYIHIYILNLLEFYFISSSIQTKLFLRSWYCFTSATDHKYR